MDVDREQYYDDGGGGSRRTGTEAAGAIDTTRRRGRGHQAAIARRGGRGGGRGDRRGDRRGGPRDDGAPSFRDFVTSTCETIRRRRRRNDGTRYQKETPAFYDDTFGTIVMMKVSGEE